MADGLKVGDTVFHYSYGSGIVQRIIFPGLAEVRFNNKSKYVCRVNLISFDQTDTKPEAKKDRAIPKVKKDITGSSKLDSTSIANKKPGILKAIDGGKLTYEQAHRVWDNRHYYHFSFSEEVKLELYKNKVKPPLAIDVCTQCGMVSDNCTCDRSWY